MSRRRRTALGVAGVLLLSGCTSFAETITAADTPGAPSPSPGADGGTAGPGCPAERAEPDPDRPRIALDFRLDDDLRTVTGTETVVFTPDRPTSELVFRLVPNAPESGRAELAVDEVRGDDVSSGGYEEVEADDPGGLYVVELADELGAGESTEVALDFTLTLGASGFDRIGVDDDVSWWASGAPLLAWEPGVGWARDPFVSQIGETTVSPVADTTLTVSAPEELTVLMTGDQDQPSAPRDGRRTWTSTEPVARDVGVAVGRFTTAERTTPGGVRVTGGALPDGDRTAAEVAEGTVRAIEDLEEHFGPFPYATLSVPLLPDYGGGIEYPSLILEATPAYSVLVHEVAHQWFYGMVGNSQFRDPWLDEAFATYAEALTDSDSARGLLGALDLEGDVGGSMADFTVPDGRYFELVYGKGAAALLTAREEAGRAAFDAAIRCYVEANAWAVATPEDVAAVLADLPEAVDVLTEAGALDEEDLPD